LDSADRNPTNHPQQPTFVSAFFMPCRVSSTKFHWGVAKKVKKFFPASLHQIPLKFKALANPSASASGEISVAQRNFAKEG